MKGKIKFLLVWMYCHRLLGFNLTNKLVRKMKGD